MNVVGKQEKVEAEEETLTSSSTLQLVTVNHLQMSCVQSTMAHEPAKVLSIKVVCCANGAKSEMLQTWTLEHFVFWDWQQWGWCL